MILNAGEAPPPPTIEESIISGPSVIAPELNTLTVLTPAIVSIASDIAPAEDTSTEDTPAIVSAPSIIAPELVAPAEALDGKYLTLLRYE